MPIYSPTGFLDVTNATLRTSNLEAENFKLNGGNIYVSTDFTVAPTLQLITNGGSVTSNTVEFTNPTTGLVVDSNIVVTGNVTAGYLYGDASNVTAVPAAQITGTLAVANGGTGTTTSTGTGSVVLSDAPTFTGDVTFDTDTLFVDSVNDRVGVGTTSPGGKLDIRGSVSDPSIPTVHIGDNAADFGDYGMVNLVRNPAESGTKAHLAFIRSGNTIFSQGYYNNTNTFGFWPSFGSVANTPAMAFATNGNVGIGVTDPDARLHIEEPTGISATTRLFHTENGFTGGSRGHFEIIEKKVGTGTGWSDFALRLQRRVDSTEQGYIEFNPDGSSGDYGIAFGNTGGGGPGEIMRIVGSTGNVGIGITNPDGTLHVKAENRMHITSGNTPAFTGLNAATSDNGRAQLVLNSAYSDLVIASSFANDNHGSTLSFTTVNPINTAEYRKFVINQGNWGTRKDFLDFGLSASTADANPHLSINSTDTVLTLDGNNKRVGIGTTSPGYKLDVNGDINSSGKINMGDFAVVGGYMASRTLTLGSTSSDYGGGNNWSANTAALLFECADNTEIAVHDSGSRVASLMHYEGSPHRITIGRDMGWGTIASVRMYGSQSYPNRPVAMVGKTNGRVYSPNVIVYDTVLYNDGGLYNSENGKFTAPEGYAGYYLVTYTGLAGEQETGPNTRWQLNGNDLSWGSAHVNLGTGVNMSTANARLSMNNQMIYYLNAGDYLTHRLLTGSIYGGATTHSTTVVMFMGSR